MMNPYCPNTERYDAMKYRRCGKSGILLPEISLGLWHNFGEVNSFTESQKMILHAFDKGVTHFDFANNYGIPLGSAEETFGQVIQKSLAPYRHELFISSKAGYDMWQGPYGNWGSRKYLMNSLEQSLKRMNLEYVDIFYSHRYDPNTPLEETMQALVDIVKQGKSLYVGISNYPQEAATIAYRYLKERDVPCLLYQGKYNMLMRDVEQKILSQAQENNTGFIAFSPLAEGLLTDKYILGKIPDNSRLAHKLNDNSTRTKLNENSISKSSLERLKKLQNIAIQREQNLAQMALAWLLKDALVTSVIIGASSVNQLNNNLKAIKNTSFSNEELKKINDIIEE